MRVILAMTVAALLAFPAHADDSAVANAFSETATSVCLSAMLDHANVADSADRMSHLKPASDATRASHPFGHDANLWEIQGRDDAAVTVRAPDQNTCSVFATNASPAEAFGLLGTALLARGDFTEVPIRRQQEGRLQRTFRSNDGSVRVELEGFTSESPAVPGEGSLAMAHFGHR